MCVNIPYTTDNYLDKERKSVFFKGKKTEYMMLATLG